MTNDTNGATNGGPASWEQLHELHGLITRDLIMRIKGQHAPAEVLGVARALLKQNGVFGEMPEQAQELRELYRLLVGQLRDAMTAGRPSSFILSEVRQFLHSQGVGKDLGAAIDHAAALQVLNAVDFPFQ
jgi:hypothetical protein